MGLLGPNQDVLTQKEFVPGGGATNSKTRALLEH